jgi:ubiquinol-cytochrome c reductase cytochrome b subunit
LVFWFWGGFRLNSATLSFFFTLHYLLPFVLLVIVFVHLILLHETSSRRRIQVHERFTKVKFNPFYSFKDILNVLLMSVFYGLAMFSPWSFGDPENWALANPIVSPVHIQPEWYFLFAYEILRSIPNKLGGVIALVLRILFLYLIPLFPSRTPQRLFLLKLNLSFLIHVFLILTWLGSCTVAEPFIFVGKIYTCLYFLSLTMFILIWVFSIISIGVLHSLGFRSNSYLTLDTNNYMIT